MTDTRLREALAEVLDGLDDNLGMATYKEMADAILAALPEHRDDVLALLGLAATVERLTAENERLRAALGDAIGCVEEWAAYASDYFKEKWDLAGDLARLTASLADEGGE